MNKENKFTVAEMIVFLKTAIPKLNIDANSPVQIRTHCTILKIQSLIIDKCDIYFIAMLYFYTVLLNHPSVMATIESIQKAYIDFVLTEGEQPKSVYIFAKKNKITEEEFYRFFGSFDAIEQNTWTGFAVKTIVEIKNQEVWTQYTAREKALSFFYSFFELLKSNRSFVVYSIKKQPKTFSTPQIFPGNKGCI